MNPLISKEIDKHVLYKRARVRVLWRRIETESVQVSQAIGLYRSGLYYVIVDENSRKRALTVWHTETCGDHSNLMLTRFALNGLHIV